MVFFSQHPLTHLKVTTIQLSLRRTFISDPQSSGLGEGNLCHPQPTVQFQKRAYDTDLTHRCNICDEVKGGYEWSESYESAQDLP